jgi:hypothetical protein
MPDEFWYGYFIRLSKVNGTNSPIIAHKLLGTFFQKAEEGSLPSITILLTRALNLTVDQFCRFHTLLPVQKAVANSDYSCVRHGDQSDLTILNYHAQKIINKELKTCSECVAEDIAFHGFAYFRREHQLPGFNCCSKHRSTLIRSRSKEFTNPDLISSIDDEVLDTTHEQLNEHILRYKTIMDSWVSSEQPIPLTRLTSLMQDRARSLELRWSREGNKRLFSDFVYECYSIGWLENLIPDIKNKVVGKYFAPLDSILTPQNNATRALVYAIALAVLFDSAEDALNASYSLINNGSISSIKPKTTDLESLSASKLYSIYVECKGIASEMARKLRITEDGMIKILNKNALAALGGTSKNTILAYLDFQNGLGLMESCLKHKVEISDLERFLRKSSTRQEMAVRLIAKNYRTAMGDHRAASHKEAFRFYAINPCTEQSV